MISTAIKFINLWSLSDLKAWRDWASHPVWKNWKSRLLNNYNAKKFVNLCWKGNYLTFWQLHLLLFTYLLYNNLTFSFQNRYRLNFAVSMQIMVFFEGPPIIALDNINSFVFTLRLVWRILAENDFKSTDIMFFIYNVKALVPIPSANQ